MEFGWMRPMPDSFHGVAFSNVPQARGSLLWFRFANGPMFFLRSGWMALGIFLFDKPTCLRAAMIVLVEVVIECSFRKAGD